MGLLDELLDENERLLRGEVRELAVKVQEELVVMEEKAKDLPPELDGKVVKVSEVVVQLLTAGRVMGTLGAALEGVLDDLETAEARVAALEGEKVALEARLGEEEQRVERYRTGVWLPELTDEEREEARSCGVVDEG